MSVRVAEQRGRAGNRLPASVHRGPADLLRSPGRPLDPGVRQEMEGRLGASFVDVRVHDGPAARAAADSVAATAFTLGPHIVFGRDSQDTGSAAGRAMLAHELTHVVQQRSGPVAGTDRGDGLRLSDPADPYERQAEQVAAAVTDDPAGSARMELAGLPPAASGWPLAGYGAPQATSTGLAPRTVQRRVTVGGVPVADPIALLRGSDPDQLLSPTGEQVLRWALANNADLTADDAEGLLQEVNRIAAMIDLVHSIVSTGILGRKTLTDRGMTYFGSNDRGDDTPLSVNVLDIRAGEHNVGQLVEKSLGAGAIGSFSVAMERPVNEDIIVDQMREALTRVPDPALLSDEEQQQIRQQADGDAELERMAIKLRSKTKRGDAIIAANQEVFKQRVRNTVLAIVPEPDPKIAHKGPGYGGYESSVPSDQIPPGQGGFRTLVFPAWFAPFAPLLRQNVHWPEGLDVRFVGDQRITAVYRALDQNWEITIEAPDYASEITAQLEEFRYLATHILKTPTP